MKNCTPLWHEPDMAALLAVEQLRCGKKVHGIVARSTFRSQNVQTTPFSDEKVHGVVAQSTLRK